MNAIGAAPTRAEHEAASKLLPMIWGTHISRCVYVAAELGIADLLAGGPVTSAALSRATGTHEASLYRVLRLLAALGVLDEHQDRSFTLTLLGERLRSDAGAGMRSWATFTDDVCGLGPFEQFLDTVRTGVPGFQAAFGTDLFSYLGRHPEKAAIFDAATSERTAAFAPSVAQTYDFSEIGTVVDVGGGKGTLLVEILRKHTHLRGTLFEVPGVVARAQAVLDAVDLGDRCEVQAGSFFETMPPGADCYILTNVLHDWDDAKSVEILARCRRAMARAGRVLIVERLIPGDASQAVPTLLSDINMLVLSGGRERTNAEFGELLAAAGLRLGAVRPVAFPYGVIEGLSG